MSVPVGLEGLRFACECVSARRGGYSDPWAGVAKNKLLLDGTKEEILNLVARQPKTISQLAEGLSLKPASIHAHITEMLTSELIRESEEWEKRHPTERYYEPNFPVIKAEEHAEFELICQEMAERMADLFERGRKRMELAFGRTSLAERGWAFSDVAQYCYAHVQRGTRQLLEEREVLPPPAEHRNGVQWLFWAEEPKTDAGG